MWLVINATIIGGIIVAMGKIILSTKKEYVLPSVRHNVFKLFLRVIAMIGKLVLRVNTGNRARKYCINAAVVIGLSLSQLVGRKFSVYKSSSSLKA